MSQNVVVYNSTHLLSYSLHGLYSWVWLSWALYFRVFCKADGAKVSPEDSNGEGIMSSLTHVVCDRPQFLRGCCIENFHFLVIISVGHLYVGLFSLLHQSKLMRRVRERLEAKWKLILWNLISEVASCYFCHILFIKSNSLRSNQSVHQ